jgi:hypothetical protein
MMMKLFITHNVSSKWKTQIVDSCFKEWKDAPTMQSPCGRHKFQLFQKWKKMERCTKALRSRYSNEMIKGGKEVHSYIMFGHCMK